MFVFQKNGLAAEPAQRRAGDQRGAMDMGRNAPAGCQNIAHRHRTGHAPPLSNRLYAPPMGSSGKSKP
jgi:hypothetical protein